MIASLDRIAARVDAAAERIPPAAQRFPDALRHELALSFVDVSLWTQAPEPYGPNFDLARHLLNCYVAFDQEAFDELLTDLSDAADTKTALWRLRLHVAEYPPVGEPGQAPWPAFLQAVADAYFDQDAGQHIAMTDDEQERLLLRLLESLRADLQRGVRYEPDWCKFVRLAEAGEFS